MPIEQTPPDGLDVDGWDEMYEAYVEYLERRRADRTVRNYETALGAFGAFLDDRGLAVGDVGRDEAAAFIESLRDRPDLNEQGAARHVAKVDSMFSHFQDVGVLEWNPVGLENDVGRFDLNTQTRRRHVELPVLRQALRATDDDLQFVVVFLLLKWGVRRGELYNLDLRDVHLDHPVARAMPSPRTELADRPDAVFVDSEVSQGAVYNGERRAASNKREAKTVVPIDRETKDVLVWWIGRLPPSGSPAQPLLRLCGDGARNVGGRPAPGTVSETVTAWARGHGLNPKGGDREESVTAHWCRHWFTTMLRDRVSRADVEADTVSEDVTSYVKGLRGDTGTDVIDTYTHNWQRKPWVRTAYTENIPDLLA